MSRLTIRQTTISSPSRGGKFIATISTDDSCRVIESRNHETWSAAATAGLKIADRKGIEIENRGLIKARIAEGK